MILRDMNEAFACLQIFGYRFPYFRYFRTPSWKRFERAMDDFSVRLFRHIEAAAERLKTRTEDREYTILEYLLAEKKLEFGEILAFMSDFVLGGADTTSSTVTFCLYHLARNPEAQDRARQEVLDVVGNESRTLEPEQLNQLPFLKACVKESLRLNPTLSGVFRKLDHEVILSGYLVPAGTPLFTENYVASRLEENFTRADEFLPERWLKRDDQGRQDWVLHPFASLPFSFGARMCLGRRLAELEIWIVLVKKTTPALGDIVSGVEPCGWMGACTAVEPRNAQCLVVFHETSITLQNSWQPNLFLEDLRVTPTPLEGSSYRLEA
ncbi:hypothetical protein HPB47_027264 [Ixodes persulcatus]|uniref:Uncharacterized protein n=1 Tax=Ixodes persulcatus TaxID=34615 RepID=A0AC60PX04_IXOPE|nr:hypothetical protein HPB47_027264 [Ixodes persulcatus]